MPLDLGDWANVATMLGAATAIGVLLFAAYQIRQNTNIARGQFWLQLEEMFSGFDDVHVKLRPGGEWAEAGSGPDSVSEWARLEDYMGLFEHCEVMLRRNLIDWETFGAIFSYRLHNIVENETIVNAKLVRERTYWEGFLRLLARLEITIDHPPPLLGAPAEESARLPGPA